MKFAILSDIHANLEALNLVLDVCRENHIENYICLGDIVGYNANPSECLEIVRSLPNLVTVKGNHDEYASNGDEEMLGFNPHAKAAVLWTKFQLSEENLRYLAGLPMRASVKGSNMTIVHATLDDPQAWGYIFDVHQAHDNFQYQFTQVCFCGHSHSPIAFMKKPVTVSEGKPIEEISFWAGKTDENGNPAIDIYSPDAITLEIKTGYKYLINVGSVGQPRNRDPRASFAIYDTEAKTVTRCCLPYDIRATQQKILAAGLPDRLALRLEHGL